MILIIILFIKKGVNLHQTQEPIQLQSHFQCIHHNKSVNANINFIYHKFINSEFAQTSQYNQMASICTPSTESAKYHESAIT